MTLSFNKGHFCDLCYSNSYGTLIMPMTVRYSEDDNTGFIVNIEHIGKHGNH